MEAPAVLLLLCGAACSSHYSTLRQEEGEQATIFAMDDDLAFQLAYEAMAETLPGRKIDEVHGRARGYFTTFRFALDTYSQQVLVFPVVGRTAAGEGVHGCYYEVSGSGSSFVQGRAKNGELFDRLKEKAHQYGNPTVVEDVTPRDYQMTPAAGGTSVSQRLAALKQMLDDGLINEKDYQAKKADLLREL